MVEKKYTPNIGIIKDFSEEKQAYLIESEFRGKKYEFWYRINVPYTSKKGNEMEGAWIPEDPIVDDKVEYAFSILDPKGVKIKYLKYLGIVE